MMLRLKYSYQLRLTPLRKNGKSSVFFNVFYRNRKQTLYTGISLPPSSWNKDKERVKQGALVNGIYYSEYNNRLNDEEHFIVDYFTGCSIKDTEPSFMELKTRFNDKFNSRDSKGGEEFYYYFDKYIETQSTTRGWNQSMIDKHKRIENGLQKHCPNLKFSDLSVSMMQKILAWWSEGLDGEGTYNDYISATLSCFRSFVSWAKSKNCLVNEEFFTFKPKLRNSILEPRFLTINEVKQIMELEIPTSSPLYRVREFFLFQCGTSLRYSDLKKLTKKDITKDENGKFIIKIVTQKNKKAVNIPLTQIALEIYLKHKDFDYPGGVLLPVMSNQKYNDYLKELGEKAGLEGEWVDHQWRLDKEIVVRHPKKDLGTHVARRTFVSTAINEGVSPELIALITSHADLKEMAPYIGLSSQGAVKVTDAIDNAFNNEVDEHNRYV